MSGKSFILHQGERVVQPRQNEALGQAVDTINQGGAGQTFNISISVGSDVSDGTVGKLRDTILSVIRDASERGQPVINEKGIVRA
jgi:hypothetical protein